MELGTIQWDKKTVMKLLEMIENDRDLKDMFCRMMDSYKSAYMRYGNTLEEEILKHA